MVKFAPFLLLPDPSAVWRAMSIRNNYVRVHEAADILGVAPNTVRKWGAAGKIPEYRHPANSYRLYKRHDLEAFLRRLEKSLTSPVKSKR